MDEPITFKLFSIHEKSTIKFSIDIVTQGYRSASFDYYDVYIDDIYDASESSLGVVTCWEYRTTKNKLGKLKLADPTLWNYIKKRINLFPKQYEMLHSGKYKIITKQLLSEVRNMEHA